jgi:UDP-N-acetylglucosamine 2-epimerase (non-hydrolysing)
VNLAHEGIPSERVHLVGNVMIDSLVHCRDQIEASDALTRLSLQPRGYGLLTLHRPSNVDAEESLRRILVALEAIQKRLPLVFPIHPRTRQRLDDGALRSLVARLGNVRFLGPLPYFDCLRLASQAALVLTDSGGLQEETTFLGVPCLTARPNTERPVTVTEGTSVIVGNATDAIVREATRILDGNAKRGRVPELWDGKAAPRIATIIERFVRPEGVAVTAAHGC